MSKRFQDKLSPRSKPGFPFLICLFFIGFILGNLCPSTISERASRILLHRAESNYQLKSLSPEFEFKVGERNRSSVFRPDFQLKEDPESSFWRLIDRIPVTDLSAFCILFLSELIFARFQSNTYTTFQEIKDPHSPNQRKEKIKIRSEGWQKIFPVSFSPLPLTRLIKLIFNQLQNKKSWAQRSFLALQIGFLFGIAVDAFKVGS